MYSAQVLSNNSDISLYRGGLGRSSSRRDAQAEVRGWPPGPFHAKSPCCVEMGPLVSDRWRLVLNDKGVPRIVVRVSLGHVLRGMATSRSLTRQTGYRL